MQKEYIAHCICVCLFPALEERETRCNAGIQTHCQEVKDERGLISKLLRVKFWFIHIFLPKFCHNCLPSPTCACVVGEVASLSVNGEERSLVLLHKNSKLTWLSLHLTRYDTIVCQRQIGLMSQPLLAFPRGSGFQSLSLLIILEATRAGRCLGVYCLSKEL